MPLDPSILQNALYQLSTTDKPPDPFTAASRIASAYRTYAAAGSALGFPLATPGPGVITMDLALGAAFAALPGAPPVVAAGFVSMATLFWTGAIFAGVPLPGVAAPPTLTPALLAAVSTLLLVPNTAETYSLLVATALHTATMSTLVTFPQPSGPPIIGPVV